MTRVFESVAALGALVGTDLGVSEAVEVDQGAIDAFARATGDHQWIHVDTARAAREMPEGKTIAHGYLTLALLPRLAQQIYQVRTDKPVFNYGLNKVRFTQAVQVGARLRLRLKLSAVSTTGAGVLVAMENLVEAEGASRPVLVAENLVLYTA